MWKKYGRTREGTDENATRRMRFACWIPKATDTHSEHVIFIAFFPLQQRLRERVSMLRYTYVACLVISVFESDSRCSYCGVVYFVFFTNARHQLKSKIA